MKKRMGKSTNMYVMFGLLAVLFVSLGYLSMQVREGFREGNTAADMSKIIKTLTTDNSKKNEEEEKTTTATATATATDGFKGKRQGFRGREGMTIECPAGKSRKTPDGPCQ